MKTLYQTAYNVHRLADGTPMAEVILHSHEGRDPVTRELRNLSEARFVANADVLKAVVNRLEVLGKLLRAMELDSPLVELTEGEQ